MMRYVKNSFHTQKKFCSKISHDINRYQEENASWELAQGEIMFINGSNGVSAILLWPNRLAGPKRKQFSVLEVVPCGGESGQEQVGQWRVSLLVRNLRENRERENWQQLQA